MAVTHASRTGKTYFLHSGPKHDGGVQHFFSTKSTGNLADRLPEGFEIYEAAWTGQRQLEIPTEKLKV